jgi:lipoprotein-anchoring transpeptidase ErfK/SrfK
MSPDPGDPKTFWIQDVPWTMYFEGPFAIHASFWHDDLGRPKSGGCVNLSPKDARAIFEWSGPALPDGWQGVAHGGPNGPGARVVVVP